MGVARIGRYAALFGALVLGFSAGAFAQQKVTLRLAWVTPDNPNDSYAIGANLFKRAVESGSAGRIEVRTFPGGQLGDEKQTLEGLRFGTVDAAVITNAVVSQVEPAFMVNDLPFMYSNESQAHKVLDGKVGEELSKRLAAKGIVALAFMEAGFRHMINNVRPVNQVADIKGVKYRVMQNPVYIDMFSALGGNAVPMAWGETFTAVQQGTVDGLELPINVISGLKVDEVTKYLSLTNHTYSMIALLMSKKYFDKLPPDLQKVVLEAGKASLRPQREAVAANVKNLTSALGNKMKVNAVADLTPFRAAMKPIYDKYRSSIGPALMDEALSAVK